MESKQKIEKLAKYRSLLAMWQETKLPTIRSEINQDTAWVRREVIEAGCFGTLTLTPPPITGGLIMRDVDPFSPVMFDPPYGLNIIGPVIDMIERTIGVLRAGPAPTKHEAKVRMDMDVQKGYAFVAMPINAGDPQLVDVLDAIKEVASRCGILAERADEPASNERITDRILESIRKAEYVIADLTYSRPNVFYEAGYAQGLGKTPIYVAREGTRLEFDLKDYPIIFFPNLKGLKDGLEKRLRGLAKSRAIATKTNR